MPREPLAPRELALAVLVLPLLVLVPIWLATATPAMETGPRSDQLHYAMMALPEIESGEVTTTAPWCWRVLTPFQASLWPVGDHPRRDVIGHFKTLAFLSNWVSLALLYGLLRRSDASQRAAVFGVLAFAGVHWTIKFSFRAPGYVDFQMQMLLLATWALMSKRHYWATIPIFALAAIQKEAGLLAIPVVALHRWGTRRRFGAEDGLWIACAALVPLAAVAVVRAAIPATNDYEPTDTVLRVLSQQLPDPSFWPRLFVAVFSGLGLLPLLLLWQWRSAGRFLRANPHWTALLGLGALSLFGGVDKARLFLPMVPAMAVVAAMVWQPFLEKAGRDALIWAVATLLLNAYLGHHFEPMGAPGDALARLAPIHAAGSMGGSLARIAVVAALWCGMTAALVRRSER